MSIQTIKKSIYAVSAPALFLATKTFAADNTPVNTLNNAVNSITPSGTNTDLTALIQLILNILIGLIGVAAVIMLIIGGLRYVFSSGNEAGVKSAKDTILYAIIGIVIAILAFAIVQFVINGLQS